MSRQYIKLTGVWLLLQGTLGAVMFGVTTFLFDFSGGQYRMGPVVLDGFLAVGVFVLASGMLALVKTQSLGTAVRVLLVSAVLAWSIAAFVEWRLSFPLGN
jgi:hypothetical protein